MYGGSACTLHFLAKQMTNGNVTLGLDPQIGDQAHILYYSDIHPCTVIKRTKKFVWVQNDNYKLNISRRLKYSDIVTFNLEGFTSVH